jgi:hypothetical protein
VDDQHDAGCSAAAEALSEQLVGVSRRAVASGSADAGDGELAPPKRFVGGVVGGEGLGELGDHDVDPDPATSRFGFEPAKR